MARKQSVHYIVIITTSILMFGCTLDEIHLQPKCLKQPDFSQSDTHTYDKTPLDVPSSLCPEQASAYPYCYRDLTQHKLDVYMCTICPKGEFYCTGECLNTPCPDPENKPKCIYFDDLTSHETSDYPNPPLVESHCSESKPAYLYCYSNANNTDHLCTRCDKDSETPRYCPDTKTCVDTYCDKCSERHISLTLEGQSLNFCAEPILSAADFIKASRESNNTRKYVLMNDIDLSDYPHYSDGTVQDWQGFVDFRGTIVALEPHEISIKGGEGTLSCGNASKCGLFTTLRGATLHNIRLNFNVNHPGDVGLLTGSASDSLLSHIEASGNVSATTARVGGIAGALLSGTTLVNAHYSGEVLAPKAQNVGGIIGEASESTLRSIQLSAASVTGNSHVGGIAGYLDAESTLTDATLAEDSSVSAEDIVGGIVGLSKAPLRALTSGGTITMVTSNTNEPHFIGGIVGQQDGAPLTDLKNQAAITVTDTVEPHYQSEAITTHVGGIAGSILGEVELSMLSNAGNIQYHGKTDPDMLEEKFCSTQIGGIAGSLGGPEVLPTLDGAVNTGTIYAPQAQCVGGIVGKATNAVIRNAKNEGAVTSEGNRIAGIAGQLFFDNLSINVPFIHYEQLENTGDITGHSHVGGIFGFVYATRYLPIYMTFRELQNSGQIQDTQHRIDIAAPHGGIIGQFSAKIKNATLSHLRNSGRIYAPQSKSVGGLIGLWVHYSSITSVVPDKLDYTIQYAYSDAEITGRELIGGLIGELSFTWQDLLFVQCHLTCYDIDTTLMLNNAYVEGVFYGQGVIGGLIGLFSSTSGATPCRLFPDYSDNSCPGYSQDSETFMQNSILDIRNAYAAVDINAEYNTTGLLGYLINYDAPSESNHISIDNYYFSRYKSPVASLSGLFCLADPSAKATPEVGNIYAEKMMHDVFKINDHIAAHSEVTTFQYKSTANGPRIFVGDHPFIDVLNENRGEHAEWTEKVMPDTAVHLPTLLFPSQDTP